VIGHYCHSTSNRRHGFTLLELMLTLSIMVVLASLTLPLMQKPFAVQRLRDAADVMRTEWVGARVKALNSGDVYLFRYVPEENRYTIECRRDPSTMTDSIWGDVAADPTATQTTAELQPGEQTLPKGVTFVGSETAADTRAATIVSTTDTMATDGSEPILFYPDGTTSTARLVLKNEYGRTIQLSLRGLTGIVTVGKPTTADEGFQ